MRPNENPPYGRVGAGAYVGGPGGGQNYNLCPLGLGSHNSIFCLSKQMRTPHSFLCRFALFVLNEKVQRFQILQTQEHNKKMSRKQLELK